jgi:hypothetical protein
MLLLDIVMQLQQILCAREILVFIFLLIPCIRGRFWARGYESESSGWVLNVLLVKLERCRMEWGGNARRLAMRRGRRGFVRVGGVVNLGFVSSC